MRPLNFLLMGAKKTVSAYSRLLGCFSIQVLSRSLVTSVVACALNVVRQSGTHASISVVDCDEYIERKLLSLTTHTRFRQEGKVGGCLCICH